MLSSGSYQFWKKTELGKNVGVRNTPSKFYSFTNEYNNQSTEKKYISGDNL